LKLLYLASDALIFITKIKKLTKSKFMKHTKLIIVVVALLAVAYSQDECVSNPMRNVNNEFSPNINDTNTTAAFLDTPTAYPVDATFCKAMSGEDVCCSLDGFKVLYAKWNATKTRMVAARADRLKLYDD